MTIFMFYKEQKNKYEIYCSETHVFCSENLCGGRKVQSVHDGHLGEFVWRIESGIGDLSRGAGIFKVGIN